MQAGDWVAFKGIPRSYVVERVFDAYRQSVETIMPARAVITRRTWRGVRERIGAPVENLALILTEAELLALYERDEREEARG